MHQTRLYVHTDSGVCGTMHSVLPDIGDQNLCMSFSQPGRHLEVVWEAGLRTVAV